MSRQRMQLQFERLEERDCPSGSYLFVPDFDNQMVLRFDAHTGAFVDEFVTRRDGGLNQPYSVLLGPHDHNLYVSTGHFQGPGQIKAVLRFDGTTGAFIDEFVQRGQMDMAHALTFGPDGNVYVGVRDEGNTGHPVGGRIARFSGITGKFMDDFVPLLSGGLKHPAAHVFGPDANGDGHLDLYVSDEGPSRVLLYNGVTGAFLSEFVPSGSGGLSFANGLTFGLDGNLYVASTGTRSVMRYQGPSGAIPGAPMPSPGNTGAYFVAAGNGGLLDSSGVIFGPDGNGDGHQDLYVSNVDLHNNGLIKARDANVKRYDGVTGAFIDTFVPPGAGGLKDTSLIAFTETDPVTLAYTGTTKTSAAVSALGLAPVAGLLAPPLPLIDSGAISSILPATTLAVPAPAMNTPWRLESQLPAGTAIHEQATDAQRLRIGDQTFAAIGADQAIDWLDTTDVLFAASWNDNAKGGHGRLCHLDPICK